jgi:hypothetical protein
LNEGDSTPITGDNDMFYVDSVRFINYDSVIRKTIYFHDLSGDYFPVWIEGIGSTAGINQNYTQPILNYWDMPELLCCYYNNKLVFQSTNGNAYGCSFEHFSPVFTGLYFLSDTLHLNEGISLAVYVYDYPILFGASLVIEITNPHGGHIQIYPNAPVAGEYPNFYTAWTSAQDLEQIRGDWYVSGVHIEDPDGNILNYSYSRQNALDSFYFDTPNAVPNLINQKLSVYPNPASSRLYLSGISGSEISNIRISNSTGILMQSSTDAENGIDIRNLLPGVYFVEIITKSNNRINLKFIKLKL